MALQILQVIISSVNNVDDYIIRVTVRSLNTMHHGVLRSYRRWVDHLRGTYEILQDVVIASQDSDSMRTSELAAKHAFLHTCDDLMDRIDELLKHPVRESASILEPSQLPATSHTALWELLLTSQRVMQQRHHRVIQSFSTLSITASTSDNDVSHAAHTPELPEIELPNVTPSCPIAIERLYAPYESSMASTATRVTEVLSSLIQCTSEEDSSLRVPRGRESDQISTILELRCHSNTYAFTSLLSWSNPSSLLQSSYSGQHGRTESTAAFHGELQPSTCRCCTRSSHRLDNCIPSLPKGLQPAGSDKGCGIKRDYSLCHEVALSHYAISCTVLKCNEPHKGRHKYHPEKSLGDDTANQKAPFSSPSSSSIVAQSNCAGRHLLLGARFPDDDIANLQAPSSSPPFSSTVVTTGYLSRHNTGQLDRPQDDDTANLPAPSHSSLSYSSDATQSTLVPDTSPVTQSHRSVILPTPSLVDRYPLFPFVGHSAPAFVGVIRQNMRGFRAARHLTIPVRTRSIRNHRTLTYWAKEMERQLVNSNSATVLPEFPWKSSRTSSYESCNLSNDKPNSVFSTFRVPLEDFWTPSLTCSTSYFPPSIVGPSPCLCILLLDHDHHLVGSISATGCQPGHHPGHYLGRFPTSPTSRLTLVFQSSEKLWNIPGLQHSSAGHPALKHPPLERRPTTTYGCAGFWPHSTLGRKTLIFRDTRHLYLHSHCGMSVSLELFGGSCVSSTLHVSSMSFHTTQLRCAASATPWREMSAYETSAGSLLDVGALPNISTRHSLHTWPIGATSITLPRCGALTWPLSPVLSPKRSSHSSQQPLRLFSQSPAPSWRVPIAGAECRTATLRKGKFQSRPTNTPLRNLSAGTRHNNTYIHNWIFFIASWDPLSDWNWNQLGLRPVITSIYRSSLDPFYHRHHRRLKLSIFGVHFQPNRIHISNHK